MPATLDQPVIPDEPNAIHDPPIGQPVLDDSNIKAMAAKFKENWSQAPADGKVVTPNTGAVPDTGSSKTGPGDKQQIQGEPAKDTGKPGELDDVPALAPNTSPTREHFRRLEQAAGSFKERAKKLQEEKLTFETRAKQLEDELNKTKASLPPNLEEIQKALADAKRLADENKKLTEVVETTNLERSPRFQNWWKTETAKHIKVAQAHVPPEHREEFAKLLLAPASPERNAALDAIVEPLPPTSRRLATGALEQIESLKIQREEALTQGSERWKELQAHEKAEAEKAQSQRQVRLQQVSDEAVKRARSLSAFQPTGDAAKDSEIAHREAFVRAVVAGKLDEDTMLNVPAAAVEGLYLRETVVPSLKAEIAKQAELIKQLQGSNPNPGSGHGASSSKAENKSEKEGTSFAAKMRELWPGK